MKSQKGFRTCTLLVSFTALGTLITPAPFVSAQIRTTYDGVPLNEPFQIQVNGALLKVPAGYLAPWPSGKYRDKVIETKMFAFNFWMPSRRYVEISHFSIVGTRPQEKGRVPPTADSYVVKVSDAQLLDPDKLDYRSPDWRFQNLVSTPGLSSYSFKTEDFGLTRFWRTNWPHTQSEPHIRYRNLDGMEPKILLRCTPPAIPKPNPLCDGYVYFSQDRLSFYLVLGRRDLPNWRETVAAARDLFESWKVK